MGRQAEWPLETGEITEILMIASIRENDLEQEIKDAVHQWTDFLAKGAFQSAFDFTSHSDDIDWTPEFLENVISNYGSTEPLPDDSRYAVSDYRLAAGKSDGVRISRFKSPDGKTIGRVEFELPLNGEWSDLTAMFLVVREDSRVILQLVDLHVL